MVFLFGYNVPLVEILVIISIMILLFFIVLIYSLSKVIGINKKLDTVLKEEKAFKKELDETKLEEDEQLRLVRRLVREMSILHIIGKEEHENLLMVKKLLNEFESGGVHISGRPSKRHVKRLNKAITKLEKVSSKEDKQLQYLNKLVSKLR